MCFLCFADRLGMAKHTIFQKRGNKAKKTNKKISGVSTGRVICAVHTA